MAPPTWALTLVVVPCLVLQRQVTFGAPLTGQHLQRLQTRLANLQHQQQQQQQPADDTTMIYYREQYDFVNNLNIDTSLSMDGYKRPLLTEIVNTQAEIYLTWEALRRYFVAQFQRLLSSDHFRDEAHAELVFSRAQVRLKVGQIKWTQLLWSKLYTVIKNYDDYYPVEIKQLNKTTPNWHVLTIEEELREQQVTLEAYTAKQVSDSEATSSNVYTQVDEMIDAHFDCSHAPPVQVASESELEQEPDWTQATPPLCQDFNQRLEMIRDYMDRKFTRLVIDKQLYVCGEMRVTKLEKLFKVWVSELEKFRLDSIESNKSDVIPKPPGNGNVDENKLVLNLDIGKDLDLPSYSDDEDED